jgi:hypothetical protein
MNGNLHTAYRTLERRMSTLAEDDGDAFLPNPEPECPVQYVLICMEPSLGRWARSADEARLRVEEGFRNFLFSPEDFIVHFCVRRCLCGAAERYHITDMSKGAMLGALARPARAQRYHRWYPLLQEEIDLVATPDAVIVAFGNEVHRYLERHPPRRPFFRVIHYSPLAARAKCSDRRSRRSLPGVQGFGLLGRSGRHGRDCPRLCTSVCQIPRRESEAIVEE